MEVVRFTMNSKGLRMIKTGSPVVDYRGNFIGKVTSSVSVEGCQIGLAYVSRSYMKEGLRIGIFLLPDDEKTLAEKPKSALGAGDKVLLPEDGVLLSRFPLRRE